MIKKLTDKELSLIMSYADEQLDSSELEKVKKLISENTEAKLAYEDLKLSKNFYGDYVSSIKDNSSKLILKNKDRLENRKINIFEVIFKKPLRNFVAYPIAGIFMLVFLVRTGIDLSEPTITNTNISGVQQISPGFELKI